MHNCAISAKDIKINSLSHPLREAELRYYLLRLFRCTSFADSIHSVSDLRFHLSFFQYLNLSWVNQLLAFLAEKSSLIYKVYKEND